MPYYDTHNDYLLDKLSLTPPYTAIIGEDSSRYDITLKMEAEFQDEEFARCCHAKGWKTYLDMYLAENLTGAFEKNQAIENANDFRYFQHLCGVPEKAFFQCRSMRSVSFFPRTIEYIGAMAFCACSQLHDVPLSRQYHLKKINDYAFNGCSSLERIVIPRSVQSIGSYCFAFCTSLKEIWIDSEKTPPSIPDEHVFDVTSSLESIYVWNDNVKEQMMSSEGWSIFSDKIKVRE